MRKTAIAILTLLMCAFGLLAIASEQNQIGSKENAKWTATTHESATSDDNKKWLARGKQGTITGEVIDVSCYLQLGKTGPKHADCGGKCVRNGQPAGILTADKKVYVVMAEEHHPRRDGQVSVKETLASKMGQQITASGMIQETEQGNAIFVAASGLK